MLGSKCCYNCNQPDHLKKNCPALFSPKQVQNPKSKFSPNTPSQAEICLQWNQRATPRCLLSDNSCKFHRQHVCLVCKKNGCKQLLHESKDPKGTTPNDLEKKLSSKFQAQFDSLCSKLETVLPKSNPSTPPPTPPATPASNNPASPDYSLFGMPSLVTDTVGIPDLSKKYIMWAKVKSAGTELSLPLNSCCSVTLCSLSHAQHVQQLHPHLKITRLTKPVAINVANEDAVLQGIALQDVPINWGPGKSSVHTMLVVPKLAWHILFGNNHLEATDAIVKHKERIVSFNHPQMQFAIKCPREAPIRPCGRVETNVVSLSTVVQTPQKLVPDINIVQVCLAIATIGRVLLLPFQSSMIADVIQFPAGKCWIEASPLFTSTHLHVIPGPIHIDQIQNESNTRQNTFVRSDCKNIIVKNIIARVICMVKNIIDCKNIIVTWKFIQKLYNQFKKCKILLLFSSVNVKN